MATTKQKILSAWSNMGKKYNDAYKKAEQKDVPGHLANQVMNKRYPGGWATSESNVLERDFIKKGLKPKGTFNVLKEKWVKPKK